MYSRVAPPDEGLNVHSSGATECDTKKNECSGVVEDEDERHGSREKPSHVSTEKWQKFQLLKERRRELGKPSPEKRKDKGKKLRNRKESSGLTSKTETKPGSHIFSENKSAWKELCQNIDINTHLTQDSIAKEKPKNKLEIEIDKAMKDGDFSKAETISDEIVQQELGVKIVGAIEARDYKKRKEIEEKSQWANKKRKLVWGFEQKERWESKGNM